MYLLCYCLDMKQYNNYFVERTLSYFLIKSFYDFIFCTMCQRGEDSMA